MTSSQTFCSSAPMILSLWTSSSLRNWYSYLRSFVWSNSEILRQYSKKRSTFPKTQRQMTFLTVSSTCGMQPFVILQAPFMQVKPTQKKMSPQESTASLQTITFHLYQRSYAIITRRLPPKQKTKTGKQAQKPNQYHSPVERQSKTEKKPIRPATRTGTSESRTKQSFTTSCQGAIWRLDRTAMENPAKTKAMMSLPLSSELMPRSSRMQALRLVSTMGMLRFSRQSSSDCDLRYRTSFPPPPPVQRWCRMVATLCSRNCRRLLYSSSIYSSSQMSSGGSEAGLGVGVCLMVSCMAKCSISKFIITLITDGQSISSNNVKHFLTQTSYRKQKKSQCNIDFCLKYTIGCIFNQKTQLSQRNTCHFHQNTHYSSSLRMKLMIYLSQKIGDQLAVMYTGSAAFIRREHFKGVTPILRYLHNRCCIPTPITVIGGRPDRQKVPCLEPLLHPPLDQLMRPHHQFQPVVLQELTSGTPSEQPPHSS